jgi:FkbM family methyltransferase
MERFSQNSEQDYILEYFKDRKGKYLDIGAFDGRTLSNTYALLESGWEGVLVEASPTMFTAMQRILHGRNVHLCNACIVTEPVTGMITFYDNDQATATISTSHVSKWEEQTPFRPITVWPVHYNAILGYYGTDFDMVSVDVEGQSAELFLKLFPLLPKVGLWVVEHDNRQAEIREIAQGFSVLYENGENLVLGRK